MSRERMVVFLLAFFLLFVLSTASILESDIGEDLGLLDMLFTMKELTGIDVPLIGGTMVAFISGLAIYVLYREGRGGL